MREPIRRRPELGGLRLQSAAVARDSVALIDRNVELVAFGVFEQQVFALDVVQRKPHDAGVARDAMLGVHHIRARLKAIQNRGIARGSTLPGGSDDMPVAKDFAIGEEMELDLVVAPPSVYASVDDLHSPRRRRHLDAQCQRRILLTHPRKNFVLFENLAQALCLLRRDDDRPVVREQGLYLLDKPLEPPTKQGHLPANIDISSTGRATEGFQPIGMLPNAIWRVEARRFATFDHVR